MGKPVGLAEATHAAAPPLRADEELARLFDDRPGDERTRSGRRLVSDGDG
jgi:hypothetical protein